MEITFRSIEKTRVPANLGWFWLPIRCLGDIQLARFTPSQYNLTTMGSLPLDFGRLVVSASLVFLLFGVSALCAEPLYRYTGLEIFRALADDNHYKYFFLLLIPTGSYFAIANWVGWQYYRNA